MQNKLALVAAAVSTLACGLLSTAAATTPVVSTIVAATLQAMTAPAATSTSPPPPAGTSFAADGVSIVVPTGLATGASAETVTAVTDQSGAPWDVAPAYTRLTLEGYALQGKFFQPQVMIYPAPEYAAASNGAGISIQRLQAILASPSAPITNDVLPRLPFVNADQIIGAAPMIIPFINGSGVRALAEYAQYPAQINNLELFYHFEGLTGDGRFYIVATLPINAGFVAPGSDPSSAAPSGGVPFPPAGSTDTSAFEKYYQAVTNMLNATSPDAFQPTLTDLDLLIQSLQVTR